MAKYILTDWEVMRKTDDFGETGRYRARREGGPLHAVDATIKDIPDGWTPHSFMDLAESDFAKRFPGDELDTSEARKSYDKSESLREAWVRNTQEQVRNMSAAEMARLMPECTVERYTMGDSLKLVRVPDREA